MTGFYLRGPKVSALGPLGTVSTKQFNGGKATSSALRIGQRLIVSVPRLVSTMLLCYVVLSGRNFASLAQPQMTAGPDQATQHIAQSETQKDPKLQPQPQTQNAPQTQAPTSGLGVPSDEVMLILIRTSLIALNQANATGNYTVLRDLAAPRFKEANSPEKLAQTFANMRKRNLDLAPILTVLPKLYRMAEITPKGMLRITGFFPTEPERINFDLLFEAVQGRWRLSDFALVSKGGARPQQVPAATASPQPAPPQAPAGSQTKPAGPPSTSAADQGASKAEDGSLKKQTPKTDGDIRDRLENPSSPPEEEKPKERSLWNPFAR